MFGAKSPLAVAFVGRNQLQFFGVRGNTIVSLDVPETLVRDMAVVDRPGLEKHVEAALTRENGPIGPLVLVLAESVYFSRVIVEADESKREAVTQQFFDAVPFATVLKKTYQQEKGVALVATNRELIEVLATVFTRAGYTIISVIPSFVLDSAGVKQTLDEDMVLAVRKNVALIQKFRLDEAKEFSGRGGKELSLGEQKSNRFPVLLAIFILLFIVFLTVAILQFGK